MKNNILILLVFLLAQTPVIAQNWHYDFNEAKQIAQKESKRIVLVFSGSDWCTPCIKLEKEILSSDEFISYSNEHYVMLRADFPRKRKNRLSAEQQKKNDDLAETYNPNGIFPLVVVLDKNGKIIGETGYEKISPKQFIEKLNSFK